MSLTNTLLDMRVTFTLAPALAERLEAIARRRDCLLEDALQDALRDGLEAAAAEPSARSPFPPLPTYDMGAPTLDLSTAIDVLDARDDEALVRARRSGR